MRPQLTVCPATCASGLDMLQYTALNSPRLQEATESSGTPTGGAPAPSHKYSLKIQPQPPRFPFVDHFFDVKVYLVDENDTMKVGSQCPIEVKLMYSDGEPVPDQSILETSGSSSGLLISSQGMLSLRVRIREVSMKHENRRFCLQFSRRDDRLFPQKFRVTPATTTEMSVIRNKLKLQIPSDFPDVWYKDEGGRDKYIGFGVQLTDAFGNPVTTRKVPLKVILCYAGKSETVVKTQSILRLSSDSNAAIDSNGRASIRVRIEEVSKNHQKQAFCVKVSPDTSFSPANYDIAPDISPAITVKSKRNKRRGAHRRGQALAEKKARLDPSSRLASSSQLNMAGPGSSALPSAEQIARIRDNGDFGMQIEMVRDWCKYVVDELLQRIEWHHVGFECTSDGRQNIQRPISRCPSCWSYKDSLRPPRHHADCKLIKSLREYKLCDVDSTLGRLVSILGVKSGRARSSKSAAPMRSSSLRVASEDIPSALPMSPSFGTPVAQSPAGFGMPGMDAVPMQRGLSLGFLKDQSSSVFASNEPDGEQRVENVLFSQTEHGFPAFDSADKLVGFYVYDDASTVISFFRLSQYNNVTPERVAEIESAIAAAQRGESKYRVVRKAEEVTIEKVKEQVMMLIFNLPSRP